jgi:hypothetical protein
MPLFSLLNLRTKSEVRIIAIPKTLKIKAGALEKLPMKLRTNVVAVAPILQPKITIEVA